ncbi:FeoA family protein [Magnetovibrio sp. PR-2]|uniref:FeoA family protein n=1 Tax=Magnetovibrio sp. PR-2 TaxID=3120356 RepID=UPI002FCE1AE3
MTKTTLNLADLKPGQEGVIAGINGDLDLKRRLSSMGIVRGVKVSLGQKAPLGDPCTYEVLDYMLSLRKSEAEKIQLQDADE